MLTALLLTGCNVPAAPVVNDCVTDDDECENGTLVPALHDGCRGRLVCIDSWEVA